MLELMKEYNRLKKRYNDAEKYFADENITVEDKKKQNDNIIKLHYDITVVITKILGLGYQISDEEYRLGFRQIQFLEDNLSTHNQR